MSFWDKGLKTVIRSIGESVVFKGTGSPDLNETVRAVFSDVGMMLDLATFNKVLDNEPHLLLRISDLSREPQQDDIFSVRGQEYFVGYVQKDGEGGARVVLREKES